MSRNLIFLSRSASLKPQNASCQMQFGVKEVDITPEQQAFMMDEFDSFTHKYQEAFQLGTLFVYMKSHGNTNLRGTPMIHCRLQFRTVRGTFYQRKRRLGNRTHIPRRIRSPGSPTTQKQRTACIQSSICPGLPAQDRAATRRKLNLFLASSVNFFLSLKNQIATISILP